MKLRIKGDSVRLRVGPAEVQRLMDSGRIEETVHFAPGVHLTYALEHSEAAACLSASFTLDKVAVTVPTSVARAWADGDDVGIYGVVPNGSGSLDLAVEKDFACLDSTHEGKHDAYPNPKAAC
ncbi:MAG: hypothetical protein WAL45_17985 [Terracidiphilus sp.]